MDVSAVLHNIGRRVAELRSDRGLTQEQLAEKLGIERSHMQKIERGKLNLTVRSLVVVSAALGCAPHELWTEPRSRAMRPGRPRRKKASPEPGGTSD